MPELSRRLCRLSCVADYVIGRGSRGMVTLSPEPKGALDVTTSLQARSTGSPRHRDSDALCRIRQRKPCADLQGAKCSPPRSWRPTSRASTKAPKSHYRLTGERVSSVSSSWAKADVVARPGFQSTFQNATVVAVRLAGTGQWVVVDLGSAQVGCGIAPNKVLADLFSTKTPCPPGTGIG